MNYGKLFVMMIISFIIMYTVMFLSTDRFDHVYLSLTRTYTTLLMVFPMTALMLLVMGNMFTSKKWNIRIITGSMILFVLVLLFLKTQTLVGDEQYIKAMIPHHSAAIMTSKNAKISDPEVRDLSLQIIRSQEEEIARMKSLLKKLQHGPAVNQ